MKISVKHAGKKPGEDYGMTLEELTDREIFSLILTVANKDVNML
jgi:hypothetical protein